MAAKYPAAPRFPGKARFLGHRAVWNGIPARSASFAMRGCAKTVTSIAMTEFASGKRRTTSWPLLALFFFAVCAGAFALYSILNESPDFFSFPAREDARRPIAATEHPEPTPLTADIPGEISAPIDLGASPQTVAGETFAEAPPDSEMPPETPEEPVAPEEGYLPEVPAASEVRPTAPASDRAFGEDAGTRENPEATNDQSAADVLYGKGKPVNDEGALVRGDIPAGQTPLLSSDLPSARDSVLGPALVDDLAGFLADNYWPAGTHPMAVNKGISTAGLKWANMRYGAQLHGFTVDHTDPHAARARVLQYVYMPSMIRSLYRLYEDRFFTVLENAGLERASGAQGGAFSNGQLADMFATYAAMASGFSGCMDAYRNTPGIQALVAAYADASDAANNAYKVFMDNEGRAGGEDAARRYQGAIMRREQQRERLAAALRRGGNTRPLDADSLVYAALWLHRRGDGKNAAVAALSEVFRSAAERLRGLEKTYRQRPAREIAGREGPS